MPLYMDRHDVNSATAEDVAMAHVRDLEVQDKYNVRYLTYWFDGSNGSVFCLAEAPSRNAAEAVHREAHGLVANQIIEVDGRAVQDFLGRIQEPPAGRPWTETAFRTILFTDLEGSTTLTQRLGDERSMQLLRDHDRIIREALVALGGTEVKHTGDGMMASFPSVARAIECAIAIQRRFIEYTQKHPETPLRARIGLSAGEPVTEQDDLFGAAVQLAARVCAAATPGRILVSNVVRELCVGKGFLFEDAGRRKLKGFEGPTRLFEVRWGENAS